MRLFIDTGSVKEVEEIAAWGVLSGATTNPSLLAKEEDARGVTLRLYDILKGEDVWKQTFAAGSHVLQPDCDDLAGAVEPTGKTVVLQAIPAPSSALPAGTAYSPVTPRTAETTSASLRSWSPSIVALPSLRR